MQVVGWSFCILGLAPEFCGLSFFLSVVLRYARSEFLELILLPPRCRADGGWAVEQQRLCSSNYVGAMIKEHLEPATPNGGQVYRSIDRGSEQGGFAHKGFSSIILLYYCRSGSQLQGSNSDHPKSRACTDLCAIPCWSCTAHHRKWCWSCGEFQLRIENLPGTDKRNGLSGFIAVVLFIRVFLCELRILFSTDLLRVCWPQKSSREMSLSVVSVWHVP